MKMNSINESVTLQNGLQTGWLGEHPDRERVRF